MPTPLHWSVPAELSAAEALLVGKLQRSGKFYVFLKAALDIEWQDPAAQTDALTRLLAEVDRLEAWVAAQAAVATAPAVHAALTRLRHVLTQDLEPDPTTGQSQIRRGARSTALDR